MIFPTYSPAPPTPLDHFADYLLLGAGIMIFLFSVLYGVFSRWTLTPGGKSVMVFVTSLDFLLALVITGRFNGGDYPLRDVLRTFVYGYVLVAAFGLVINLLMTWLTGNHGISIEMRNKGGRMVPETYQETALRLAEHKEKARVKSEAKINRGRARTD